MHATGHSATSVGAPKGRAKWLGCWNCGHAGVWGCLSIPKQESLCIGADLSGVACRMWWGKSCFGGRPTKVGGLMGQAHRGVPGARLWYQEDRWRVDSTDYCRHLAIWAEEGQDEKWHPPALLFLEKSLAILCPSITHSKISQ